MRVFKSISRLRHGGEGGNSLLETAVTLPLLLGIAFNAINFGYFWFMVLALSAAPRHAVQYASQGGAATATSSAPITDAVEAVVISNITNAVHGSVSSNISVRVCASSVGLTGTGASQVAQCTTYGPSYSYPAITADPEAPEFVLQRVDVAYTVTPLIPGTAFNVVLPSNLVFHRQVSMRSLW
jgi:Flp pilus assembly protein TadG